MGGLLLCASTLQFVCLLFALRNRSINFRVRFNGGKRFSFSSICPLCLDDTSRRCFLSFLFFSSLSFFPYLFLFRLSLFSAYLFTPRCESLWRIKNSGRWIGLNTNFKEWNDVERICNFAEGVDFENFARTLKRLDHREIFSNSSIFFFFSSTEKKIAISRSFHPRRYSSNNINRFSFPACLVSNIPNFKQNLNCKSVNKIDRVEQEETTRI